MFAGSSRNRDLSNFDEGSDLLVRLGKTKVNFFSFDSDCIETLGAFDQCFNDDTCQRDLKNSSCNPIYF